MPRKQRVEFPGAVYHIISRGNYRKDLFRNPATTEAFEKALFETVDRCEWKLYAYVIMRNHYHLAVETPEPNLVAGMKWLQGTFATRFNRFHGERGHVFQGRYKSLVVEPDRSLLGLIDYIHLNPVRAGICRLENLKEYRFCSYYHYFKRVRPEGLDREALLSFLSLPNSLRGMRGYQQHLALSEEGDPGKRDELYRNYCRGWFIGSKKAKQELAEELVNKEPNVDWEGVDLRALNRAKWEKIVLTEMKRLKKSEKDLIEDLKGAPWKIEIAKRLRQQTPANNVWIARRLHMGHPNRVSSAVNK